MGVAWIFIGCVITLIFVMVILGIFIHGSDDRW